MTQPIRQQCYFFHGFKFGTFWKIVSACLLGGTLLAPPVFAQVIPDRTLGKERSQVKTIDAVNQRVEGGAARGSNLFHSFLDFNVAEGRGVYFANPQGIESILSRVTGQNPSHILGRLGVLGQADLYLLNPNGIVFGPNASLDIQGSFFGSTANSIALGEEGVFSAVAPQQSQLLAVRPQVGFLSQAADHPGSIINQARLSTGQDLSLTAGQLNLQGQLRAGSNLTLQAADSLKIRDSKTSPFVAAAGKHLLVQGNQSVDIFALNHPESGFFSGGDMVLRSTNPVGGDAHYTSGGSFLVQQLNGEPGTLFSPYDPIIRSLGDVSFDSYSGSSLHILAAGSVNINTINITGPELGTSGTDFIQEAIQLSDGTIVNIDGSSQPTLDIRSGVSPAEVITSQITGIDVSTDSFLPNPPNLGNSPTSANIDIGNITFQPIFSDGGRVLLTNQYKPNTNLVGDITLLGNINTSDFFGGGLVAIDSKGNINLGNQSTPSFINASGLQVGDLFFENGGDVTLLASKDVTLNSRSVIIANGLLGGTITLNSKDKILLDNGAIISEAFTNESGLKSDDITINSKTLMLKENSVIFSRTQGQADAGDTKINVDKLMVRDGSIITTSAFPNTTGRGGNLEVDAQSVELIGSISFLTSQGNVETQASGLRSQAGGIGNGGDITINTEKLFIRDGAGISIQTFGEGTGGTLDINALRSINLSGESIGEGSLPSGIFTVTSGLFTDNFAGKGGDLNITTGKLIVRDGAQIEGSTTAEGSAGNIHIIAKELIEIDGTKSSLFAESSNEFLSRPQDAGNAGNFIIETEQLTLKNGARISSGTFTSADAGSIKVKVEDKLTLADGSQIGSSTSGSGKGGDIQLQSGMLNIESKSRVSASSQGSGDAGRVNLMVKGLFSATNSDVTTSAEQASGGSIFIQAGDIRLFGDSDISTRVGSGAGTGGDIALTADSIIAFDDSDILAFAQDGRGGDITLNTPAFFGENFFGVILTGVDPDTLDGNDRVDLNATGQTSGIITVPDVSFIQNNLTELPENLVNPENLLANSCIVRTADQEQGKFIVTGPGGLPKRPGDAPLSSFPTGTVQTPTNSPTSPPSNSDTSWQSGEPIVEPQGVYQLKNGQLVMSRECSDL